MKAMKLSKMERQPQRPKWLSLSNVMYAALTLFALVLFMQDAQASGSLQAFLLNLQ